MTLTVLTPPGEEALPLAEAKAFLRIGHDGEDALVAASAEVSALALAEATLPLADALAVGGGASDPDWRATTDLGEGQLGVPYYPVIM